MTTKLYLHIFLHSYDTRRRVALVKIIVFTFLVFLDYWSRSIRTLLRSTRNFTCLNYVYFKSVSFFAFIISMSNFLFLSCRYFKYFIRWLVVNGSWLRLIPPPPRTHTARQHAFIHTVFYSLNVFAELAAFRDNNNKFGKHRFISKNWSGEP